MLRNIAADARASGKLRNPQAVKICEAIEEEATSRLHPELITPLPSVDYLKKPSPSWFGRVREDSDRSGEIDFLERAVSETSRSRGEIIHELVRRRLWHFDRIAHAHASADIDFILHSARKKGPRTLMGTLKDIVMDITDPILGRSAQRKLLTETEILEGGLDVDEHYEDKIVPPALRPGNQPAEVTFVGGQDPKLTIKFLLPIEGNAYPLLAPWLVVVDKVDDHLENYTLFLDGAEKMLRFPDFVWTPVYREQATVLAGLNQQVLPKANDRPRQHLINIYPVMHSSTGMAGIYPSVC